MGSVEHIRTIPTHTSEAGENEQFQTGEKQTERVAIDFGGMNPEVHAAITEVCVGEHCPPEVGESHEIPSAAVQSDSEALPSEYEAVTDQVAAIEVTEKPEALIAEESVSAEEQLEETAMHVQTNEASPEPRVEVHESERGTSVYSEGEAVNSGWSHYVEQEPSKPDKVVTMTELPHADTMSVEMVADPEKSDETTESLADISQLSYAELLDIPPAELMKHPNAHEIIDAAHRKAQAELTSELVPEAPPEDDEVVYKAAEERIFNMLGVSQMTQNDTETSAGSLATHKAASVSDTIENAVEAAVVDLEKSESAPVVRKLTPVAAESTLETEEAQGIEVASPAPAAVESEVVPEDAKLRMGYLDKIAEFNGVVDELRQGEVDNVVQVLIDRFEDDKNRLEAALGIGAHNIGSETEHVAYTDGQKLGFEKDFTTLEKVFGDIQKFSAQAEVVPEVTPDTSDEQPGEAFREQTISTLDALAVRLTDSKQQADLKLYQPVERARLNKMIKTLRDTMGHDLKANVPSYTKSQVAAFNLQLQQISELTEKIISTESSATSESTEQPISDTVESGLSPENRDAENQETQINDTDELAENLTQDGEQGMVEAINDVTEAARELFRKEMNQLFKGGIESDEWLRGSGILRARRALAPQQVKHFFMTKGHLTDDRVVKWLQNLQERSGQLAYEPNETLGEYVPRLYEAIVNIEGVDAKSGSSVFRQTA